MQPKQQDSFKEWVNGLPVNVATFKTLREQEEELRSEVYKLGARSSQKTAEAMAKLKIVEARLDRLAISGCDETLAMCYGKGGLAYDPSQMRWIP